MSDHARFDAALDAWVLSRYADVLAAFREPRLWPAGSRPRPDAPLPDEVSGARVREETFAALSSATMAKIGGDMGRLAGTLFEALPAGSPVDLVADFLRPWCLHLAAISTGINPSDAQGFAERANRIAAAASEPDDPELRASAASATAELKPFFHSGPAPLREAGFVALSETLMRLLANMWHALFQHPAARAQLRENPDLLPRAIEELMRHTGLARTLYRTATEDLVLNGLRIEKGQRVVLRVDAANHDPEQFPDPDRLDFDRRAVGHFALGNGPHSCAGASLLRMAAMVATREFITRFADADLAAPVEWEGGSGFQSPKSLLVTAK